MSFVGVLIWTCIGLVFSLALSQPTNALICFLIATVWILISEVERGQKR